MSDDILDPRANRARLIAALRAPLPEGFKWDFSVLLETTECGSAGCALGLAATIWPRYAEMLLGWDTNAERATFFGLLGWREVDRIFFGGYNGYSKISIHEVTPGMVADSLEAAPYAEMHVEG
jgi:hypothetical protein